MIYVIGVIILAAAIGLVYSKIRNTLFAAKDAVLVKEDQALAAKETEIKANIKNLTDNIKPADPLNPEEVEAFWSKK